MMNDMLSQQEINELLKGAETKDEGTDLLTYEEKDTLGEIGNISMGTSATTLFSLLGQKVVITTPKVGLVSWEDLEETYPRPYVAVEVSYEEGLEGTNLLAMQEHDVKIITDLMMGGEGKAEDDSPLTDLHLSAISEAMNQMIGSSSTSLSQMFSKKINISPPKSFIIDFTSPESVKQSVFHNEEKLVKVSFRMQVGDLIDSELMQLYPLDFGKALVNSLGRTEEIDIDDELDRLLEMHETNQNPMEEVSPMPGNNQAYDNNPRQNPPINQQYQNNQAVQQQQNNYAPSFYPNQPSGNMHHNVNVSPIQFQSFDGNVDKSYNENIEIIIDVPLNISVELGRTKKSIKEILEFGPGTLIELDKLAGEPLDILVNGKYVAKGEVVIIDESFGIRITDIIHPSKRISKL